MSELSIFIDESGDFGESSNPFDNYLVTFVFHNQTQSIKKQADYLENNLKENGFFLDYIHTAPIIRRENVFENYSLDERRSLIYKILNFMIKCPIKHYTVIVNRKEADTPHALAAKISRGITNMIQENKAFFKGYDNIIVYYDNGQHELSVILSAIFSTFFENMEFRTVEQQKYRLLQAADFICTMELLKIKHVNNRLSKSEKSFFYKPQELKRTFFKALEKSRL